MRLDGGLGRATTVFCQYGKGGLEEMRDMVGLSADCGGLVGPFTDLSCNPSSSELIWRSLLV